MLEPTRQELRGTAPQHPFALFMCVPYAQRRLHLQRLESPAKGQALHVPWQLCSYQQILLPIVSVLLNVCGVSHDGRLCWIIRLAPEASAALVRSDEVLTVVIGGGLETR